MNRNWLWAAKLLAWLIGILAILVLIVFPLLASRLAEQGKMPLGIESLVYITMAQTFVMRAFGVVWVFFLGSCFASFLNVVAWRIPRGRGINGSSHCPFCDHKLSFRDNIPIVGWIRNAGRCATCRLPISPRYLIVEFVLGTVFLLIVSVELLCGGWNLPFRPVGSVLGFEYVILDPPHDLIRLTAYHLVLICSLFTFVLIRIDRFKIPVSIFAVSIAIGIALPLIWPVMQLVPWRINSAEYWITPRFSIDMWVTLVSGITGGIVCGNFASIVFSVKPDGQLETSEKRPTNKGATINEYVAGFVLVGVFLGWQSAISVLIIFSIASLVTPRTSVSARLFVSALVYLLLWRWLSLSAIGF